MLYYIYFSNFGLPKENLSPSWQSLITAENSVSRIDSAPSIHEIGGGWYRFELILGQGAWDTITEDLVGVIDGGDELADTERYRSVCVSLRQLGLARIAHKGMQEKETGTITIFATDGVTEAMQLEMNEDATTISRIPKGV